MSQKSSRTSRVAYMQEEDDKGNIRDDITYAASAAPSPTKDKMNIGRKKSRRGESPSAGNAYTDSDSTVHPRRQESRTSRSSRDREKSVPPSKKSVTLPARPSRHSKTAPSVDATNHRRRSQEASYYGVDPTTITSASSRPRSKTAAPRPSSYYGPSRPPVSNARYHHMAQTQAMPPPPPPSVLPGGPPVFPPQHWQHGPPHPATPVGYPMMPPPPPPGPPPPPSSLPPQADFVPPSHGPQRPLQNRFNLLRPQTSTGHRVPQAIEYGSADVYEPDDLTRGMRRLSMNYNQSIEDDRSRAMPLRPVSALPSTLHASPFAPPPAPPKLRQVTYGYDDPFDEIENPFQEIPTQYDYQPLTHVSRTRRQSIGPATSVYDSRPYATEVARTTGSRRNSYYGAQSVSSGSGFEDKLRLASSYQDEMSGGMQLTAEMLREANRSVGPRSRSTRSSGSRDESDWRQSATTRTTRSSNEEDFTIRVKGHAFVRYGEAEMQCRDGTEINITSRGPLTSRRITGSDKSSYADPDDRRSRFDRPALRSRAASQAESAYAPPPAPPFGYSYGSSYDYNRGPFDPLPTTHWP